MAFNGNVTVVQSSDISGFTITDTSTGTDANLTDRQVGIYTVGGSLLTGSIIDWPIANGPLVLTGILPIDYSLSIVVTWISSSPLAPPSTYTQTSVNTFIGNTMNFLNGLVQQIAAQQGITNDNGFLTNMNILYTYLDNAILSQSFGNQGNAQENLTLALGMINNKILFF